MAILEAATALLIWGGSIEIISSHNGVDNPFNQMLNDIQAGRYGTEPEDAAAMIITFDDAVENGLYERVCLMDRKEPSIEGKKKWYNGIRKAYGPRIAAMREELDAIPRSGSGARLPSVWIDQAMPEVRPVFRLTLDDEFSHKPEDEPSAAEKAAEDLNVLFPHQTIPLGGKDILVQEYPFMTWLTLKPLCADFIEKLAVITQQEASFFDDLLEFFESNFQVLQKLLCESTEQPLEFLKTLKDEEMDLLLLTWWTVNKHFFLKSVGRLLRKTQEKPSDGQTSSSA